MAVGFTNGIPSLQEVARAATTGNLAQVYQKAMETLEFILRARVASLQLVDEDSNELIFVAALKSGDLEKLQRRGPIPINEESISGFVAERGEPLLFYDSWEDLKFGEKQRQIAEREGFDNKSYICAPLVARGRTIGVLNILHHDPDQFTEDDKDVAVAIASYIAMSVAQAQFIRRLSQVATAVSSLDLDLIYDKSMEALRLLLNAQVGSLQLVSDGGHKLKFVAALKPGDLATLQDIGLIPINEESISGFVAERGEPLLFYDSWEDLNFGEKQRQIAEREGVDNRSYICVPILAREGDVLGVLNVLHGEPNQFSQEDLETTRILAAFIGAGLQNARQMEELLNVERAAAIADAANNLIHSINNKVGLIKNQIRLLERRRKQGKLDDEYLWEEKLPAIRQLAEDTLGKVARFRELDQVQRVNPVNVGYCIDEAITKLQFSLDLKDVTVIVDPFDDTPHVDATGQLTDVFENLLQNSMEAMQDSDERKVYIIVKEIVNNRMRISISDTGPGLPPTIEARLFQFGATTKKDSVGGGYGLWWVKTWLRRIGGDIYYDETYEGGARFIIELSLSPPGKQLAR